MNTIRDCHWIGIRAIMPTQAQFWHNSSIFTFIHPANLLMKKIKTTGILNEKHIQLECLYYTEKKPCYWYMSPQCPITYQQISWEIPQGQPQLTLHVLNFVSRNINIYITIIPPQWHDTGGWNPSTCKTKAYLPSLHSQYHGCWCPGDTEQLTHWGQVHICVCKLHHHWFT